MKVYALNFFEKLDDQIIMSLLSCIDDAKRERLLKYVYWKDLQRGLLADLLIRKALIEETNLCNEEIHFSINEFGKPYCDFLEVLNFNVSHSGNWVVCAIDINPVGIDIEKISLIDLDISKNYFSEKEHESLLLSNDPIEYFFTLWSLKESYIKFIGKGLSLPLNSFSVKISEISGISIDVDNKVLGNVHFKQYSIDKGYKMAVCSLNQKMPELPVIYAVNDLVDHFILNLM